MMNMNATLADEMSSINAIYPPDTLVRATSGDGTFVLRVLPSNISLRLLFPASYPEQSPVVLGPESAGLDMRKGQASEIVSIVKSVLNDCFRPGQPCLYDLLEELMTRVPLVSAASPEDEESQEIFSSPEVAPVSNANTLNLQWVLSDVITEKKSIFLARAVRARTPSEARSYIQHLVTTDKKASKATHNISAWRLRAPSSDASFQDCDDDGESAAGGRLLHLMQLMDVWDVVIVVSRWYGGIHLGPDRFRIINSVARDALVKGKFDDSKGAKPGIREQGK